MAPIRRGRRASKSAANRDLDGYEAAAIKRKSARLTAAANTSNGELVLEKKVKSEKEQPCLPVDRKQEVHEAKPDHPIPFPLYLDSHYVNTGPWAWELKDVEVAKVELALEEKKHAFEALSLILQAACDLQLSELGGLPSSLDRDHDIIWDWRSVELSSNEYGAFAHAVVNYLGLDCGMNLVSYDWTPLDSRRGILSVRKKCGFQSLLTRILTSVINDAMYNNELLTSLVECVGLDHQIRVSVLTGTVGGMRTPCRCWRYTKRANLRESQQGEEENEKEEPRPFDNIQDFVLEVGMGEKTQFLSTLAHSYIERGTLCVMTVKMERQGKYDFDWSYSLYRRGKMRRFSEQITRYEVVCVVQDVRVKINKDNVIEFPARLTLFDFVPSSVLKKNGVTRKNDKKAIMNLRMSSEQLDETEAKLGGLLRKGKSISQHLEKLENLW